MINKDLELKDKKGRNPKGEEIQRLCEKDIHNFG